MLNILEQITLLTDKMFAEQQKLILKVTDLIQEQQDAIGGLGIITLFNTLLLLVLMYKVFRK